MNRSLGRESVDESSHWLADLRAVPASCVSVERDPAIQGEESTQADFLALAGVFRFAVEGGEARPGL
jgi:hypothetical protein